MKNIIQKSKFSDQASKYIRDLIINKELKSGDRIVETRIAKQLGISQAPVREALKELEVMGLVELKPYVGCVVAPLSKKKLLQVYNLRTILECHAVCESLKLITQTDISAMEEKISEMKKDAQNNDSISLIKHDVEFHEILIDSADNAMLKKMWMLVGAAQWSGITIASKPDLEYYAESHNVILEKIKEGNPTAVKKELKQHFLNAAHIVVHHISDDKDDLERMD